MKAKKFGLQQVVLIGVSAMLFGAATTLLFGAAIGERIPNSSLFVATVGFIVLSQAVMIVSVVLGASFEEGPGDAT